MKTIEQLKEIIERENLECADITRLAIYNEIVDVLEENKDEERVAKLVSIVYNEYLHSKNVVDYIELAYAFAQVVNLGEEINDELRDYGWDFYYAHQYN